MLVFDQTRNNYIMAMPPTDPCNLQAVTINQFHGSTHVMWLWQQLCRN